MNYVLVSYQDHYAILNDDADFIVGRARPSSGQQGPFRVTADLAPDSESDDVAVVHAALSGSIRSHGFIADRQPLFGRHLASVGSVMPPIRVTSRTQFGSIQKSTGDHARIALKIELALNSNGRF